MRSTRVILVSTLMVLMTLPLWAQRPGDTGNVGVGREGAMWQTEIDIAKDELAEFEAELSRMAHEEWMEIALAWIEYGYSEDRRIDVEDSHRVALVDPGKKAEVEELTIDPPTWGIAWGKKAPRSLKLVLTDTNRTAVECALAAKKKMEAGYMGVFLRENSVVCLPRGPFSESDEDEPAS